MITQRRIAHLGCEVYVPHDENNNPVGRVKWYRSLDIVTSEELTHTDDHHNYVLRDLIASELVSAGDFAGLGLYKHLYVLSINNISSSDNGYYWCRILNNQPCLSPSPYVNVSVTTVSDVDNCSFTVNPENNPVCANMINDVCILLSTVILAPTEFHSSTPTVTHNKNFTPIATHDHSSTLKVTHITLSSSNTDHSPILTTSGSPNLQSDINEPVFQVVITTAGFVLFSISLIFCCIGIYICQRRTRRQIKGE